MTIPRFLLALIILYVLAFKLNVQEIGSFYSSQYGGAPWSWGKFVNLIQHIWPVVFVATLGGLAYNMRVMRGNLLDTLNAQYVETARAKGLSEGAVIMKHAVPNALHPLVAYQGVVLPYMLTGEIEVAIVFALATIGPAIVGSMSIGDVNVTATLLLVLGATLIVGNIIADLLLAAARSAHPGGERRMTERHLPPIEDPLVPERSLGDQIVPEVLGHARIPIPPSTPTPGQHGLDREPELLQPGLAALPQVGPRHDRPRPGRAAAHRRGLRRLLRAASNPNAAGRRLRAARQDQLARCRARAGG